MKSGSLTTGQAARLCSVTPDAVLKWIRSGRLRARRTGGGHHRIERGDLEEFLSASDREVAAEKRPFTFCWEYNGGGQLLNGCRECAVYQMRAHRCYEVVKLAPDSGHTKLFCEQTCDDCDYFRTVHAQATNVLLVTDNELLAGQLAEDAASASFSLEVTDCEYACSALVEAFRPDYVVVDCSLGPEPSRDIANHLMANPRVPFVKVIMAADEGELPSDCDKQVFATIKKPLKIKGIAGLIRGADEL